MNQTRAQSAAWIRTLKQAGSQWLKDDISLHASSLAYYTVFSIAPLLIIAIAVAGFIFGSEASQGQIFEQVQGLMGPSGASAVQSMVKTASDQPESGIFATVIGVLTLLYGGSRVFEQLQYSLNIIWAVHAPEGAGVSNWIRRRVLTFAMVGVIAFLLLVSLIASAAISAAGKYFGISAIWQGVNFFVSICVIGVLFASVYKFLPDVKIKWRDLWGPSLFTAALFSLGKWVIGLYLGKSAVSSSYGAAGSLVVLLIWVYYSSMIFYFGAELTKASTLQGGRKVIPRAGARIKN